MLSQGCYPVLAIIRRWALLFRTHMSWTSLIADSRTLFGSVGVVDPKWVKGPPFGPSAEPSTRISGTGKSEPEVDVARAEPIDITIIVLETQNAQASLQLMQLSKPTRGQRFWQQERLPSSHDSALTSNLKPEHAQKVHKHPFGRRPGKRKYVASHEAPGQSTRGGQQFDT